MTVEVRLMAGDKIVATSKDLRLWSNTLAAILQTEERSAPHVYEEPYMGGKLQMFLLPDGSVSNWVLRTNCNTIASDALPKGSTIEAVRSIIERKGL